jgi:hypothetical protein
MGKLYLIDGVPHRLRRGKYVRIPDEWVGSNVHAKHRRKQTAKARLIGSVRDSQGTGKTGARMHLPVRGEDRKAGPSPKEARGKAEHRPYNRDDRSGQVRKQVDEQTTEDET